MHNLGEKGEGGNSGLMLDCKTSITDPITLRNVGLQWLSPASPQSITHLIHSLVMAQLNTRETT